MHENFVYEAISNKFRKHFNKELNDHFCFSLGDLHTMFSPRSSLVVIWSIWTINPHHRVRINCYLTDLEIISYEIVVKGNSYNSILGYCHTFKDAITLANKGVLLEISKQCFNGLFDNPYWDNLNKVSKLDVDASIVSDSPLLWFPNGCNSEELKKIDNYGYSINIPKNKQINFG